MDKFQATDVFTPTTPARLTFVERESVNDRLVDSVRTPGKQIVIFGPSGGGKTTLLFNKLYQLYSRHVTVRCVGDTTFDVILRAAFDQLDPFYISNKEFKEGRKVGVSLSSEFKAIKAQLDVSKTLEEQSTSKRVIPPQLNAQRLAEFLGAVEACLVLEDFHKIPPAEKTRLVFPVSKGLKKNNSSLVDYSGDRWYYFKEMVRCFI